MGKSSGAPLGVFLIGVAVEFTLTIAKNEPVSPERLGTVVAIMIVLLAVSGLVWKKVVSLPRVVAGGLLAIGAFSVVAGIVILFSAGISRYHLDNVVGAAVSSSGVVVFLSGLYVAMRPGVVRRDDLEEYRDLDDGKTYPLFDTTSGVTATLTTFVDEPQPSVVDLCRRALGVPHLHFVAYYVNGACSFSADVLGDPGSRMRDLCGQVPARVRRRRYEAYGRLTHGLAGRLDRTFDQMEQGDLVRVVLDIHQGAYYYVSIDNRRYLFGATLDQNVVDIVDDKLRRLAIDIMRLSGRIPNGPLRPAPASPTGENIVTMEKAPKDEPA
jgi:hypothetical protein